MEIIQLSKTHSPQVISKFTLPKILWVGIGCRRGSSKELLQWAVVQALATHSLSREAIAGFATLDRKAQEAGLVTLAADWHLPIIAIAPEILSQITVPHPSVVVAQAVGTSSVAEAAAIVAAIISRGDSLPLCPSLLPKLFPKQIYRLPDQLGVVTIAIAEAVNI